MDEVATPDRIGPWLVEDVIGRGGMGIVYRAVHGETKVSAAVKTVRLVDRDQLASIRREIQALARLDHPGIVRVLDHGILSGRPWYAMELHQGDTLRHQLERTSMEERTPLLDVVARLCGALAYLHGEGIVHRDLKPENVLVRRGGMPVLVDFGLVERFAGEVSREALDLVGELAGTVAYMAPEQIRGELLDARADLYALGCIVYEILTGEPPFTGEATDVLSAHLRTSPSPPSQRVPTTPPGMDALVLGLLEKEPARRIGHADAVAARLQELCEGVPAAADAECTAEKAPAPRAYLYRPSLCGRTDALAWLREHADRIRDGGALVLLSGEAGVGKTRLALELSAAVTSPEIAVITGSCAPIAPGVEGGAAPLSPFRGVLQAIGDRCRELGEEGAERLLGPRAATLALYEPGLSDLVLPSARATEGLSPEAARRKLFDDLARTLEEMTSDAPLLFILDDLQWADELTLMFLEHVARSGTLSRMRLLIVATYRQEEETQSIASLRSLPSTRHLQVQRLSPDAVGGMVGDMLAMESPPEDLAAFVADESRGNPFFVAEYLRLAVTERLLHRDRHGRWQLPAGTATPASLQALGAPRSLTALVERRLTALPERALRLVEAVAVLGSAVEEAMVAAVAERGDDEVLEVMGLLLARHIVEEAAPGHFRFAHEQFQRVAYQSLLPERKSALHRRAAETITSRATPVPDELMAVLGHHWEEAGALDRARPCYVAAARHAEHRYAYQEAERLQRAAIALATPGTAEAMALWVDLGTMVLAAVGASPRAVEAFGQALDTARSLPDRGMEARCLQGIATAQRVMGHMEEALELYGQALEASRAAGEESVEILALHNLAILHHELGRLDEAHRAYEEVLRRTEARRPRMSWANALTNLGNLHREQGRMAEAMSAYQRAIDCHRAEGNRRFEGSAMLNMAVLLTDLGSHREACDLASRALDIQRDVGSVRGEAYALAYLATAQMLAGEMERARASLSQARSVAEQIADRHLSTSLSALEAEDLIAQGRFPDAKAVLDDVLLIQRQLGDRRGEAPTLRFLARIARLCGDTEGARVLLGECYANVSQLGTVVTMGPCLCEMGHLALASGADGGDELRRAETIAEDLGAKEGSELRRSIARLRHAVRARASGKPLWRGEAADALPLGTPPPPDAAGRSE